MGLSLSSLTERFLQVISSLATSSRPNEWSRAPNRRVPQQERWFVSLEHWMLLFLHHQNNITRLSVTTRLLFRQWRTCRSHHETVISAAVTVLCDLKKSSEPVVAKTSSDFASGCSSAVSLNAIFRRRENLVVRAPPELHTRTSS